MYEKSVLKQTLGISLSDKQVERVNRYIEMLLLRNRQTNLTAITAPDEILVKHIEDCGRLCRMLNAEESVIDVGTGAGFPGIIVAILREDVTVTMLDSIGKKLDFVKEVVLELGLKAEVINGRAEVLGKDVEYRERYDVATARAVADMAMLAEICLPLVCVGGRVLAMKGASGRKEEEEARAAIALLGGAEARIDEYKLSDGSERAVIVCDKISNTPDKYPRNSAQIKKKPLKNC